MVVEIMAVVSGLHEILSIRAYLRVVTGGGGGYSAGGGYGQGGNSGGQAGYGAQPGFGGGAAFSGYSQQGGRQLFCSAR